MSVTSTNESRRAELWDKWRHRQRFTNEELDEALRLGVGLYGRPPAEDSKDYPRFLLLWNKCARFQLHELTRDDLHDTARLGISVPFPEPSLEEVALNNRRTALLAKTMRGEPWTREDCEEAVACQAASWEEVEAYFGFIETVRARGYEPILDGGLESDSVHIHHFPRTPEGGYALPCLLDVMYRGRAMDYIDVDAPLERRFVVWIGRHRQTGNLDARTVMPHDIGLTRLSWREKVRRLVGLPTKADAPAVYRKAGDAYVFDAPSTLARWDTSDYKCVWLR